MLNLRLIAAHAYGIFPNNTVPNIAFQHMRECDISQGIFLRIKRPFIYYSSWNKVKILEYAIYDDIYGEPSFE
ncbi:hypothetical protein MXB_24 [Myxobolus squamalis]|nr:hypothetical protein MXB_24 [Myxobolus squamalis]